MKYIEGDPYYKLIISISFCGVVSILLLQLGTKLNHKES